MFALGPESPETDHHQIKFSIYVHYVEALASVTAAAHGNLHSAAAVQASEPTFNRLKRSTPANTDLLERALRNAWLTELQTLIPRLAPDLIPHSNHWLPVQVYYSVYLAARAYFEARRWEVDRKHERTLTKLQSEIFSVPSLFLLPLRVTASGDPDTIDATLANCPVVTEYVNPITSPRRTEPWNLVACLLRTTRRRRFESAVEEWRQREQKARRKVAEETKRKADTNRAKARVRLSATERTRIVEKLRPTTVFDALYRLRIRSNYEDADTYLFGNAAEAQSYFEAFNTVRSVAMLNFEMLIAQLIGPDAFQQIALSLIRADRSKLSRKTIQKRLKAIRTVM